MKRKSRLSDKTFLFFSLKETERIDFLALPITSLVQRMKPIEIKVIDSATLKLFRKDSVQIFFALDMPHRHLVRDGKTVTVIAVDNGLAKSPFASLAMIPVSRIKMGKAALHKEIDHFFKKIHIDHFFIIALYRGKSHQAEAELFHR
jgi:hypothetical protein